MRRLNTTAQIGLVVILFAFGLLVFYVLRRSPEPAQQANATNGNMVNVSAPAPETAPTGLGFEARYDIPQRSIVTPAMFKLVKLEDDESDSIYVTDLRKQAVGFITAKPIRKSFKLRKDDLLGHLSEVGVAQAIQDGYRAMVIPVANKATLHDIVSVGDFVDVMATSDQAETRVLADGVRVLAVDVYGANFETGSLAVRGPYKGDDRPGGPPPPPDPNGKPVVLNPDGSPAPTPVPQAGQAPPARPEAAITLEVRPEQAAAIALAQANNTPLDFLIQPRPTTLSQPTLTEVRVIKPQVFPYAVASKRSGGSAPQSGGVREVSSSRPRPINNTPMPDFSKGNPTTIGLPPYLPPATKKTYDITIYPDGQPARTNTVALPE